MRLHRIRVVMLIICASTLGLVGTSPVAHAQPPQQKRVDTPQEHSTEDHVTPAPATEERLQAEPRRQTSAQAQAAAAAVAGTAGDVGQWGQVVDWPVVGINVALLPNGK